MFLEREQTGEPATVAGLQQEIKALKERCGQCGWVFHPSNQR